MKVSIILYCAIRVIPPVRKRAGGLFVRVGGTRGGPGPKPESVVMMMITTLQGCDKRVPRVLQGCPKGVTGVL